METREPKLTGETRESDKTLMEYPFLYEIQLGSKHTVSEIGKMTGEWEDANHFRFRKYELKYSANGDEIQKFADHFGFANKLGQLLKSRLGSPRLDQTYHLKLEIDFGDKPAEQPTTEVAKDAFDEKGIKLYAFGDPTTGPLMPKPSKPLEFDIKLDLDKTPKEILVKTTPGGPTDEKKTINPLDREISLLRAQLETALSGKSGADTKLAKEKSDREKERLALARVLENALQNPGFLKGDLVKNVAEIVRKLKAGEKIE